MTGRWMGEGLTWKMGELVCQVGVNNLSSGRGSKKSLFIFAATVKLHMYNVIMILQKYTY